jgi:hypothetical protein
VSCKEKKDAKNHDGNLIPNSIIIKEGKYLSKEKNLKLDIAIKNGLVKYSLFDTANHSLLDNNPNEASAYQKWFFVMDDSSNIWFNSSDIGLFLLKREHNKLYKLTRYGITKDNIHNLPKVVYENLPSSSKSEP